VTSGLGADQMEGEPVTNFPLTGEEGPEGKYFFFFSLSLPFHLLGNYKHL